MNTIPQLAPRSDDSHKGDFGRALLVGGSRGMAGAIALTAMGALRSGAGLVTVAVPDVCLDTVAGFDPCYMTVALPSDSQGRLASAAAQQVTDLAQHATVMACGPGLGRSPEIESLVCSLYMTIPRPMVFDADALFALAQHPKCLVSPGGPRILTPHGGEFDRIVNAVSEHTQSRLTATPELATPELAIHCQAVVVLKGHRTLVTDGTQSQRNDTGNPGMATGGAGDVLTGVITALLCQGLDAWSAARLGVHVHGLAGDRAASQFSAVAMTARDIVRCLPDAWRELE